MLDVDLFPAEFLKQSDIVQILEVRTVDLRAFGVSGIPSGVESVGRETGLEHLPVGHSHELVQIIKFEIWLAVGCFVVMIYQFLLRMSIVR